MILKLPDNGNVLVPVPTAILRLRQSRLEYLVPYDFLDLRIFLKFLLLRSFFGFIIHRKSSRFDCNYLRDLYT